jgi:glutamyl-tRNA reductase
MLTRLVLNNFYSGFDHEGFINKSDFVMSTCQRTLVLSFNENPFDQLKDQDGHKTLKGIEAYSFLLEIICGLQSKLQAENEIVGQFKTAYKDYVTSPDRSSQVLQVIEKLFKDAKEIRTNYLLGLTQKTYSSIARKHIVNKFKSDTVLILGSGQLAEDLINQFKKKVNVFISGRNTEKVYELARLHNVEIVPWGYHENLLKFPYIANSIGFNGVLFNEDFFSDWCSRHESKLFVDLGSPSAVQTRLVYNEGVMKLDDVFEEGAIHETTKLNQIEKARSAMKSIALKRQNVFRTQSIRESERKIGRS